MKKTQNDLTADFKSKHIWFSDNRITLLFSFACAMIAWTIMSFNNSFSVQSTQKIDNIPINVQLSENAVDDDLTVFFTDRDTARVDVSGNVLSLSKVSSADINVSASGTESIIASGEYTLKLSADTQDPYSDISIVENSLKPSKVKVLVDREERAKFKIEDDVSYQVDPEYFATLARFSPEEITVEGPESLVSKIATVKATYNISSPLNSSTSIKIPLSFYDKDNNLIPNSDLDMLTISQKETTCNITVLKKTTTELRVNLTNAPSSFDYSSRVTISPQTLDVALPQEDVENFVSFSIADKDFSKLKNKINKFVVPIELPSGYKNLSNRSKATVTIDLSDYDTKYISVSKIKFINVPENKSPTALTSSVKVLLMGTESEISSIKSENITAIVDLDGKSSLSGQTELPVTFKIRDFSSCFVKGDYKVSITI